MALPTRVSRSNYIDPVESVLGDVMATRRPALPTLLPSVFVLGGHPALPASTISRAASAGPGPTTTEPPGVRTARSRRRCSADASATRSTRDRYVGGARIIEVPRH